MIIANLDKVSKYSFGLLKKTYINIHFILEFQEITQSSNNTIISNKASKFNANNGTFKRASQSMFRSFFLSFGNKRLLIFFQFIKNQRMTKLKRLQAITTKLKRLQAIQSN